MRELSVVEIEEVSGGMIEDAAKYFAVTVGIGMATFGAGWGGVVVASAVATAPIAVGAMAAFSFLGGVALRAR